MESQIVSLTGADTIVINGRLLTGLATGDVADLTFPNELMKVKTGKNGNSIYALDATGKQADLKVRLIRGSLDDKFLNSLLMRMEADPPSFILLSASLLKRSGDGMGMSTQDNYIVAGGVFTKKPGVKSNVEGDTDQAVVEYEIKFTNSKRAIF